MRIPSMLARSDDWFQFQFHALVGGAAANHLINQFLQSHSLPFDDFRELVDGCRFGLQLWIA